MILKCIWIIIHIYKVNLLKKLVQVVAMYIGSPFTFVQLTEKKEKVKKKTPKITFSIRMIIVAHGSFVHKLFNISNPCPYLIFNLSYLTR